MRIAGLIIFAVLIVLAAAAGLLFMFAGLKEGTSHEELPFLMGGVLVCLGLGAAWWRAVRRSWLMAVPIWLILSVPALLATTQTVSMVAGLIEGLRQERAAAIEGYSETPIVWAGFDGPVGLTIRFDLLHPPGSDGLILPPEIRMGPALDIPRDALSATRTSGSGTFKDFFLDQDLPDLTLLKTVLFQRLYVNDSVEREIHQWTSSARFAPGNRTSLVFHLHPGFVEYLVSESNICLNNKAPGIPRCGDGEDAKVDACVAPGRTASFDPVDNDGTDLSALWTTAVGGAMTVDLSPHLTETLRAHSALQSDPTAWAAIQQRLSPPGLKNAGYAPCPAGEDSHNGFRACYCRD